MASIFTFDPSPPSVSSPWSTPRTSTPRLESGFQGVSTRSEGNRVASIAGPHNLSILGSEDEDVIVTSLAAEPQDGPTEYKLHLLLRPRRDFVFSSTRGRVSGSTRSLSESGRPIASSTQSPQSRAAITTPSRHIRLQQLTTQLLWRLQQSSSNHYTTYKQVASQPTSSTDQSPALPSGPFPGLEDSKGALYEIGVADDGTFVGLAEDELEESLQTLSTMASSLGCTVSVLKKVAVGNCRWLEQTNDAMGKTSAKSTELTKSSTLWVAEAYVRPTIGIGGANHVKPSTHEVPAQPLSVIDQLRVTFTGVTLSGKTSLLGTLTTGTLDNGRGKSRLSLLKHQHEIASGMTSSVTHELLGYSRPDIGTGDIQIVNFASGNVSGWIDVHASCEDGRLVFFSDSAGHPRFRRTTVRGLVGWSPHWTLLCIPADSLEDTSGRLGNTPPSYETLGLPNLEVDLSQDHLQLCLKLKVPLVIVMTKIDLASRTGLRTYLNRILSTLKRAGRQPFLVPDVNQGITSSIPAQQLERVRLLLKETQIDPVVHVPIVLTSAVKGTGITSLHALLQALPIPATPHNVSENKDCIKALFDIEDTYRGGYKDTDASQKIVLSGAVRIGQLNISDELVIGPLQAKSTDVNQRSPSNQRDGDISLQPLSNYLSNTAHSSGEWCRVKVLSLRHLRLPTHALIADQVGTIAVSPCAGNADTTILQSIRKGMVLAKGTPQSSRVFVAQFARSDVDPLSIGSAVVVYFNSVRASAKIIAGAIVASAADQRVADFDDDHDDDAAATAHEGLQDDDGGATAFGFDTTGAAEAEAKAASSSSSSSSSSSVDDEQLLVTFRFLASREFVAVGSRVLVMPGGAVGLYGGSSRGEKGVAGLNGFVGLVVDSMSMGDAGQLRR